MKLNHPQRFIAISLVLCTSCGTTPVHELRSSPKPSPAPAPVQQAQGNQSAKTERATRQKQEETVQFVARDRMLEVPLDALPLSPTITWSNRVTGEKVPAVAVVSGETGQFPTPTAGEWTLIAQGGKRPSAKPSESTAGAAIAEPSSRAKKTSLSTVSTSSSTGSRASPKSSPGVESPAVVYPNEPADDKTGTELLDKARTRIAPFTLQDLKTEVVIEDSTQNVPSGSRIRQPAKEDVAFEFKAKNDVGAPKSRFTAGALTITKQTRQRVEDGKTMSITAMADYENGKLVRVIVYEKEGVVNLKDLVDGAFGTMTISLHEPLEKVTRVGFRKVMIAEGGETLNYVWEKSGAWTIEKSGNPSAK
jgi:hypothetical protein